MVMYLVSIAIALSTGAEASRAPCTYTSEERGDVGALVRRGRPWLCDDNIQHRWKTVPASMASFVATLSTRNKQL